MRSIPGTLVLAVLLGGCNPTNDNPTPARSAVDDATEGTPRAGQGRPVGQAPSVPERYRGEWAADIAACARPGEVSRLRIGQKDIRFHESEGPIVSVDDRDGTLAIVARLSGEGETRQATYAFTLSQDGNTLTDASGYARQRCSR